MKRMYWVNSGSFSPYTAFWWAQPAGFFSQVKAVPGSAWISRNVADETMKAVPSTSTIRFAA